MKIMKLIMRTSTAFIDELVIVESSKLYPRFLLLVFDFLIEVDCPSLFEVSAVFKDGGNVTGSSFIVPFSYRRLE